MVKLSWKNSITRWQIFLRDFSCSLNDLHSLFYSMAESTLFTLLSDQIHIICFTRPNPQCLFYSTIVLSISLKFTLSYLFSTQRSDSQFSSTRSLVVTFSLSLSLAYLWHTVSFYKCNVCNKPPWGHKLDLSQVLTLPQYPTRFLIISSELEDSNRPKVISSGRDERGPCRNWVSLEKLAGCLSRGRDCFSETELAC